ncbi:MAG: hypothetical protein EXS03_06525 [Phycisphaerales bacterium]|nr:hypothetical protein [Phycisphaerales bacterium]
MTGALIVALILGQNALDVNLQRGSGTDLDAGQQQGRRVNQAIPQQDYRSRNLVVTGDVAGGRGFRGTVGYSSEGDFSGALGSDSSRAFRANSALSSIGAINSIPMNDRFGLATGIGAISYRRETVSDQSSARTVPGAPGQERIAYSSRDAALANGDRARLDLATRSASTGVEYASLYEPMVVKTVPIVGGRKAKLISSPFNGLVAVPTDDAIESLSLGVYGSALLRADLRHGRADRAKIARSYVTVNERSSAARLDTKIQPAMAGIAPTAPDAAARGERRNAYDLIVNAATDRYQALRGAKEGTPPEAAGQPISTAEVVKHLREGFQRIQDEPTSAIERITGVKQASGSTIETSPTREPDADSIPAPRVAPTSDTEGKHTQQRPLTAEEVATLAAYKDVVDSLDGGSKEALDILLTSGEESMRQGRYLSAERAFISAALVAPANPLPLVGIANSQLAAGLDVAAAVALRQLLMNYPEMVGVRYSPELLGTPERLRAIAEAAIGDGTPSRNSADYGMISAYIGYQLEDRALTERGLSLLMASPEEAGFARALKAVWLPSQKPEPTPMPEPAPPMPEPASPPAIVP